MNNYDSKFSKSLLEAMDSAAVFAAAAMREGKSLAEALKMVDGELGADVKGTQTEEMIKVAIRYTYAD